MAVKISSNSPSRRSAERDFGSRDEFRDVAALEGFRDFDFSPCVFRSNPISSQKGASEAAEGATPHGRAAPPRPRRHMIRFGRIIRQHPRPPLGRRPPPPNRRNDDEDLHQQPHNHNEDQEEERPPPRRNDRNEEEIFGKLKFTMSKFQGEEDPDAYLSWVLKVDKIFRIHNFSEAKKVAMASLEFEGYANVWWEEVNKKREKEDLEPIDTSEEMQEVMHTRFVPTHHKRDLFNKLTQLKQSFKSVEEYYKEMHMTMMSANVDEREEQTMARFLNGLNIPVKRIVEFLPYKNMVELLHQATRAERQVREDLASAKTKTFFATRNKMNASSSIKNTSEIASKDPSTQARSVIKTTSFKPEQSTMSSKASTGSSNITCFKCGALIRLQRYADKPPFKPLPPKEGNEEKEEKRKKKEKKKGTKKKKKKENKKKEVTAYPA
ncbi:hypothetical protein QYE76_020550 [Lolium multiflorum]|uniref:Retrotransposon gag domain-containing protein n=1 Tax=Lolium multiflorum TaxID=4521 RepID=A0AAD8VSA9_LOLMU|nr:hypothetical protein QYE76_020550 [Lolium multiflorum]